MAKRRERNDEDSSGIKEKKAKPDEDVLVLWKQKGGAIRGDAVISVRGRKIAINKAYLSVYSPVLHRMFYNYKNLVIENVDEEIFIKLLRVILPSHEECMEEFKQEVHQLALQLHINTLEWTYEQRALFAPTFTRRDGVIVVWESLHGAVEGDGIVRVESARIAINKPYLAMHSTVFHNLFETSRRDYGSREVELPGIYADEFIEFLRVILPIRKPIYANNVEAVLAVANAFLVETIKEYDFQAFAWNRECLSYLCSAEAAAVFPILNMLHVAFKYNFGKVKTCCRRRLTSKYAVKALRAEEGYASLSSKTRNWVGYIERKLPIRTIVFFDISIGSEAAGRVIMELYDDVVPQAVEKFRVLCTGERAGGRKRKQHLHYKGSIIHGVCKGDSIYGGAIMSTAAGAEGGRVLYFWDENLHLKRPNEPGELLFAPVSDEYEPNYIGVAPQFSICIPRWDNEHVIGRVIKGLRVVAVASEAILPIVITECGQLC